MVELVAPLVSIAFALIAAGTDPAAPLREARAMIETQLRFSDAITLLEQALASKELSDSDRASGLELLGIAQVARGDRVAAQTAFEALVDLDPERGIDPLLSPKVRQVFEDARRAVALRHVEEVAPPPPPPPPPVEASAPVEAAKPPPLTAASLPPIAARPEDGATSQATPIFARWWFWAGVVVVAGAATAGIAALTSSGGGLDVRRLP